jgi:hypothetical protein
LLSLLLRLRVSKNPTQSFTHHDETKCARLVERTSSSLFASLRIPAQECFMSAPARKFSLSLDVWAVLLSFAMALLVRVGVIKSVGW